MSLRKKKKKPFRHRPLPKNKTPEVLGNVPVRGWRERGCRSDWFGGTVVKQMLGVLCGGEGGVGSGGRLTATAVLPPVLQEEVADDHQDHHDADAEEDSNHHLKGTCRGYTNVLGGLLHELWHSMGGQEGARTKAAGEAVMAKRRRGGLATEWSLQNWAQSKEENHVA